MSDKKWANNRVVPLRTLSASFSAGQVLTWEIEHAVRALLHEVEFDEMNDEEIARVAETIRLRVSVEEGEFLRIRAGLQTRSNATISLEEVEEAVAWEKFVAAKMKEYGQSRRKVQRRVRLDSFLAGYRAARGQED